MSNKRSRALMPQNRANQVVRLPTGRFAPGVSGNAGGRPKAIRELAAVAREHTPEAIETLVRNLTCGNPNAEIAAAAAILDRGFGKPPVKIDAEPSLWESISPEGHRLLSEMLELLAQQDADSPSSSECNEV